MLTLALKMFSTISLPMPCIIRDDEYRLQDKTYVQIEAISTRSMDIPLQKENVIQS